MAKFDLERFKAGEPAYDRFKGERIYLATAPNGRIVTWNTRNEQPADWPLDTVEEWTMKPKEEWVLLHKELQKVHSMVYPSKQEALDSLDAFDLEIFEAVKIVRE